MKNFKREKAYKAVPPPTDWVDSDDEETDVSESQKETIFNIKHSEESFQNRTPNSQTSVGQESRTKGLGTKGVRSRSIVPQVVLSTKITDGSYYPRVDIRRPRISNYSPSSRSSTTRTPHRPQRPKKIVKSIWVKKGSTVGSQAVPPQTVKKSAMISPKQTWKPKRKYLDSVNREEDLKDYAFIDMDALKYDRRTRTKLSDLTSSKVDLGTEFRSNLLNEFCSARKESRENIALPGLHSKMVVGRRERIDSFEAAKNYSEKDNLLDTLTKKRKGLESITGHNKDDQQFIVNHSPIPPEEKRTAARKKLNCPLKNNFSMMELIKECMSNQPPGFEDPVPLSPLQPRFTELSGHLIWPASSPKCMKRYHGGTWYSVEDDHPLDLPSPLYISFKSTPKVPSLQAVKRNFKLVSDKWTKLGTNHDKKINFQTYFQNGTPFLMNPSKVSCFTPLDSHLCYKKSQHWQAEDNRVTILTLGLQFCKGCSMPPTQSLPSQGTAAIQRTADNTRKSDGLEEVNIEEKAASNVKSEKTEELIWETTPSTAKTRSTTKRENNHFRAFDTLWEILHVLDRQDLYHLYRVVDDYYEHIPPTGLGLMLLGDLNIIWETAESSDDDFWKDQEEWEIIRWRFHESSGVHTLEIEDGTMIHMLAERRYPLSRELMIRMLEHGMEVEDESETAITLIHLFILWTTEDGDNS
ncbi:hypothetical protein Tco_0573046 [Tanacetum coccineum]